jgi:putative nucleotidyltransferase with HDIG domain
MFARALTPHEVETIRRAERFVRNNHRGEGGHDDAHVLAVTDYAIRIAEAADAAADPLVLVVGALFHDLGRIGEESGILHGLRGAAIAREYLESTSMGGDVREEILRVVARHTPTTGIAPETDEERIVFDADALDRLGIMGMLRGLMGKRGSTEAIVESRIKKRLGDYDRLHFDVSRRMGEALHADTVEIVDRFREALRTEAIELRRIPWPVDDGLEMPVPSLRHAAQFEETPDLTHAMARMDVGEDGHGAGPSGAAAAVATAHGDGMPAPTPRLSAREIALLQTVARFVEEQQADLKAHDYAHVLSVVKNALRIARAGGEEVDTFVLACGAFFHDIGWIGSDGGAQHGLRGASVANEYLTNTWVEEDRRRRIRRIVIRHSATSAQRPETVEERIVWDADGVAGVGLVGVLRGIISGVGSSAEILDACLRYAGKRQGDLHFDESRRIADARRDESDDMIGRFAIALEERRARVERLRLPGG